MRRIYDLTRTIEFIHIYRIVFANQSISSETIMGIKILQYKDVHQCALIEFFRT